MTQEKESVAWIKMPTAHLMDDRIEHLVEKEGLIGVGAYFMLVFDLYRQRTHKMTISKMLSRKYKGCSQKHLRQIIMGYGLFNIDENDIVTSAIDYCVGHSRVSKKDACDTSSDEHQMTTGCNSDDDPTYARIKTQTQTQTQSSSSYRRRNCDDDNGPFKLNLSARRVASVDEIIEQMKTPSAWSEAVIMSSGFCKLLHDNWDKALRWFRLHITERSKEGEILTVEDARRYFADLIHHPTTAALIQNYLQQLAAKEQPYPYEDPTSRPGHRSYLGGTPLPDDAPSRPGPRHEWVLGRWEEF